MAKTVKGKSNNARSEKNMDVLSKVQRIIAHQLKSQPNRITPQAHMQKDLGADSLDALEILNQMEEDFNIKISEEDARKMSTVQDTVEYITKILKSENKT